MASGFQFITSEEFKDLYKLAGRSMASEQKLMSMSPIDQILSLCNTYERMLNSVANVSMNKANSYNVNVKAGKSDKYRQVQVFGANIAFKLRRFLLDEEIFFLLGGHDPKRGFTERKIDQDTMLKNLRGSISKKAVVLTNGINRAANMQLMDAHIGDLWQQILSWAIFKNRKKEPGGEVASSDSDGTRPIYQHLSKDSMAYIGFAGAKAKPLYYYNMGGSFLSYNQGWLYEWYNRKLLQDQMELSELAETMKKAKYPLRHIFYGMDNIPGIKGGDIYNVAERQQMQAKYGNAKIMSFNNIIATIKEVTTLLNEYKAMVSNESGQAQQLALKIAQVFSTNETIINKDYDSIVDDIIKKLNS